MAARAARRPCPCRPGRSEAGPPWPPLGVEAHDAESLLALIHRREGAPVADPPLSFEVVLLVGLGATATAALWAASAVAGLLPL